MALDVTYIGCDRPEDREFVDRYLLPYVTDVLDGEETHVRVALVRPRRGAIEGDDFERTIHDVAERLRPGVAILRKRTDDDATPDGFVLLLIDDRADGGWTYLPKELLLNRSRWAKSSIVSLHTAVLRARLKTLVAGFESASVSPGGANGAVEN